MLYLHKVRRLKNSPSELDQLKELLLADELSQLKKLEEKVEMLDFEARDDATIMKRVTPAISKGVADNKETMIDALYPIMGGMISKYVTQAIKEMMETINKKIEQGLSFERVKRKAKSKITGVSETELLVEESADARLFSLFVIQKESSLLIAEANLENKEIDDAHMVASMASAIKDFINDWIENTDAVNEVQLLSYGNATLYIESAGSVFIIAFLEAEPNYEQRIKINTFFASIVKKYATFFQEFDGDDSADEVLRLSMEMEDYIYASQPTAKDKKKNPAKYIVIFLAVLLLGYGVYFFNGWYIQHSLEQTVLSQTGENIEIGKEDGFVVLEGQVSSTDVIYEIEKIMKRHSKGRILNHLTVPSTYLDKRFKAVTSLDKGSLGEMKDKLAFLEGNYDKTVNGLQKKIEGLESQIEGSKVYLSKLLKSTTDEITVLKEEKIALKKVLEVKSEIFSKLDKTFASEAYYHADTHSLDFGHLTLFAAGNTVYKPKAIAKLAKVFEKYLAILVDYKEYINSIVIEGYTDSSGAKKENIALSKKRALSVKYYLERLKIVKQYHMQTYIKTVGYGSSKAIVVDGIEDKNASRRIDITFSLKDEKILNKLGEIIND